MAVIRLELKFTIGFLLRGRFSSRVLPYTPKYEYLGTNLTKWKPFNVSQICAHALSEEKNNVAKYAFYERLKFPVMMPKFTLWTNTVFMVKWSDTSTGPEVRLIVLLDSSI